MTPYEIMMGLGCVAVIFVIGKAFWSSTRVKPLDQPDNPGNHATGQD